MSTNIQRNPFNNEPLTPVETCNLQSLHEVCNSLISNQKIWTKYAASERVVKLSAVLTYFANNRAEIAREITHCMGKPLNESVGEVNTFIDRTKSMCAQLEEAVKPLNQPRLDGISKRSIKREPIGTVLVIAPWNYPLLTAGNAIVAAILAGNCVVLKHAENTAPIGCVFEKAFQFAGSDMPFANVMTTHQDTTDAIKAGFFDHVVFTGSTQTGRLIYRACAAAEKFVQCQLELGGKDAAFIRDDVFLDEVVDKVFEGAMYNAGQSCCAIERVYVHHDILPQCISKFQEKLNQVVPGDPEDPRTTMGTLAKANIKDTVTRHYQDAKDKNAQVLEPQNWRKEHEDGLFVKPFIVVTDRNDLLIEKEETFGPAFVLKAVSSDAEAVEAINRSEFGLTAAIYTNDLSKAEVIANRLEVGTVFCNRCDYLDPYLAWSGRKDSGFGVSLSTLGIQAMTITKSLHFK